MSPHSRALPAGFIAPCLPTSAPQPPSGELWLHEIKHEGFRVIACNLIRLPLPAWVCSLPVMSKRTSPVPTKLFRWRVIRLRGSPALWVGDVDAPDEPSAIEAAIKIYNITDPEHQRRLAVRRIK
jgi:hypothetical protein